MLQDEVTRVTAELEVVKEKLSHFSSSRDLSKTVASLEATVATLNGEVGFTAAAAAACGLRVS